MVLSQFIVQERTPFSTMASSTTLLAIVIIIVMFAIRYPRKHSTHRIFPGPDGLPFLGDVLTTPIYGAVFHFKLLNDRYGPLAETTLFGQRFLLVSSNEIAKELLVDMSRSNSGRPCTFAVKDAQSKFHTSEYLPLMSFNDDHHRHKRHGRAYMTRAKADNHREIPVLAARRLMKKLLAFKGQSQTAWIRLTEELTSRVISQIVFGSAGYADRLHDETWQLLVWVSPNGVLPNLIPFLDNLPEFLSPWKRMEARRHHRQQSWFREIFESIRRGVADGSAPPCFMRDYLTAGPSQRGYADESDFIKAMGMIATAAVFTVSGPIQNVVRALACFPEWQAPLQAELDAAVPFPRCPGLSDLPQLPLLRAFVREVVRWRQTIPSWIPHETEEDVLYRGVRIPAGTAIFPLELGLNRDPEVYADPYTFDPLRWLDPASPNFRAPTDRYPSLENTPMFGWGRRYCMGHELATDEILLFAMHLVWSFKVTATHPEVFEKDLLPGEKKGGHQWPSRREEALIIMRPEPVHVEFHPRAGRKAMIEAGA